MTPGDFFTPDAPRVLAHRGFALDAPENTMLAFAAAINEGAEYVETDVHATADGVAVVAHDPTLERTAGRPERIDSLLWHELENIPLGDDQTVPTLHDVLDTFPDTRFNIDMKSDAAVAPTVRAISALRVTDRVLLTSFREARRRRARQLLPNVATSASKSIVLRAIGAAKLGSRAVMSRALRDVDALQIPERMRSTRVLSETLLALAHECGTEVHVWTVNERDDIDRLLRVGVDGIVTDRVDVALKAVAER